MTHRGRQRVRRRRRRGRRWPRSPGSCWTSWRSTRWPSCRCCWSTSTYDDRAARAVDGRDRARPTCSPSRWTSWTPPAPDDPEPGPALLGDVVLCPAVARPPGPRRRPLAGRRAACCWPPTASCTCSATTTRSRTRSGRCSALQQQLLDGWRSSPRRPVTGAPAVADPVGAVGTDERAAAIDPAGDRDLSGPARRPVRRAGRRAAAGLAGPGRGDAPRGRPARRGALRAGARRPGPARRLLLLLRIVCETAGHGAGRAVVLHGLWRTGSASRAHRRRRHDGRQLRAGRRRAAHARPAARLRASRCASAGLVAAARPGARPARLAADPASATRSPPAAASATARSPPRSSCASWSTWPRSAAWSRPASGT